MSWSGDDMVTHGAWRCLLVPPDQSFRRARLNPQFNPVPSPCASGAGGAEAAVQSASLHALTQGLKRSPVCAELLRDELLGGDGGGQH